MTRQKNKILTFIFALIPGAGQMFLGFMKRGLSLVLYVVAIACIAMMLSMEELIILVPPVWMYAFFDAINLNGCDEEHFSKIKDDYITFDIIPGMRNIPVFSDDTRKLWGKGMIYIGIAFLCFNILNIIGQLAYFLDLNKFGWIINDLLHYSPRIIISVILIMMGKSLISGNRKNSSEAINFSIFVDDHSERSGESCSEDISDGYSEYTVQAGDEKSHAEGVIFLPQLTDTEEENE